jgi:carboxylate-amine ligase
MRVIPAWARWNPAGAERPWTVGVEEEVMLLDARTWSVVNRVDDVLGVLPPPLAARASAETHACVVELKSAARASVREVAAELAALRDALDRALLEHLGLRAATAGTHPLAIRSEIAVASDARHREVAATMRALARREPTMALHVHVAVPDAACAVRTLDGLRGDLPVLLALTANSPFWRGSDSGFASMRTPIFSTFPRVGIPRHFGTYANWVDLVDRMLSAGAIPEPGFLWWDARLQPRLGTVEVRIMDAQSRVMDVAVAAAVVHCLVRHHAEHPSARATAPEIVAENRFLAARDGMRAELVGAHAGRRPAHDALAELLDVCRPHAAALGCAADLASAAELAADPGDARQRRVAARDGIAAVPEWLGEEFGAWVPTPP